MIEDMIEKMINDFLIFAIKNPIYFLCSAVYYVFASLALGGTKRAYLIAFIGYFVSLLVVFSPLGEKLLRVLEKVRKVETNEEKKLLIPVFHEVCDEAVRRKVPIERLEICVIDKMTVNACALGKHTIAVTKGAIELFTPDELKALIAHEIAHIVYLDTTAKLDAMIGNGFVTVYFLVWRILLFVIDTIREIESESKGLAFVVRLVRLFFELNIFVSMFVMQFAMSIGSRKNELRADRFVYKLGYGEEMVKALYILEKIKLGDNSTTIQ
ncbi:MAG: M48 family metalloprotease [Oscillospiraceae bacterium]|nr:M48 family metalloprotease [Oscillospiraceae bacterium]